MAEYKREWNYHVFDTNDEFKTWQANCAHERNITSIQVMDECDCGSGEAQKVMVTYWVTPPGSCGGPSSGAPLP